MKDIKTVGIIGLGDFGGFLASLLSNDVNIIGFDNNISKRHSHVTICDLKKVCSAEVVILAIPLSQYGRLLPKLYRIIKPETLLIDVCSVKTIPKQLFKKYLPSHKNILLTHPLFGPQSAAKSTVGHELIIADNRDNLSARARQVLEFCENNLKLMLRFMTAEEHDKAMAEVHALTFFVARGLTNLNMLEQKFITPSFKMILDLIQLDKSQSEELFQTVESGNLYASEIRKDFLKCLQVLDESISIN